MQVAVTVVDSVWVTVTVVVEGVAVVGVVTVTVVADCVRVTVVCCVIVAVDGRGQVGDVGLVV